MAQARRQLLAWFEARDPSNSGRVTRSVVDALVECYVGKQCAAMAPFLNSITDDKTQTSDYHAFLKTVFEKVEAQDGKDQQPNRGSEEKREKDKVSAQPQPPREDDRAPLPTPWASDHAVPEAEIPEQLRRVNPTLARVMYGKTANWDMIRYMAANIRSPEYSLEQFFDDCVDSFPELALFLEVAQVTEVESPTQSGRSAETEYQRTVGALFAVYWLCRLGPGQDGRAAFCFGVDDDWRPRQPAPEVAKPGKPTQPKADKNRPQSAARVSPTPEKTPTDGLAKRASFCQTMEWSMFEDLVTDAGCKLDVERIMALLCLTAFHDIMKISEILPRVLPEHAPYRGYAANVTIYDHDIALGYIMEKFPSLLPSYTGLPIAEKKALLFTQGGLDFNFGWFLQSEAPPGRALSGYKSAIQAGAPAKDIALYFLHWFTDLAGAEATPLGGAEKFVLKFPQPVLTSFLQCMPQLSKLRQQTETEVYEDHLKQRWSSLTQGRALPSGQEAPALLRLAVMGGPTAVDAFQALPETDRTVLSTELARTGCAGQRFECAKEFPEWGGPAMLVYYGPQMLHQHARDADNLKSALRMLSEVLRAGRKLWPLQKKKAEGETVILQIGAVKAAPIKDVVSAKQGQAQQRWVMIRKNDNEAVVEMRTLSELGESSTAGRLNFTVLDFVGAPVLARNASSQQRVEKSLSKSLTKGDLAQASDGKNLTKGAVAQVGAKKSLTKGAIAQAGDAKK